MKLVVNPSSIEDYRKFLAVKGLPSFRCSGSELSFPDEYAHLVNGSQKRAHSAEYDPALRLFDYQAAIVRMAIRKRKFAIFADCGLGKTLMLLEYARHAQGQIGERKTLIVAPLMVVRQTLGEAARFYGDKLPIEAVKAADLPIWLNTPSRGVIGITNYDALTEELTQGHLGALILDESSVLKSHYGKWGQVLLRLGAGLTWKLCLTGTPAPNDRIEYANHAVFLDAFPTVNAFLARYFVNRGQTQERWVLKPHAIGPFYRSISHWSIFLANPQVYGWQDNTTNIPPIETHIHHIDLTESQRDAVYDTTRELFVTAAGGITKRSKLGQIGKGAGGVESRKPEFIQQLIGSWSAEESTIIWCIYNEEQAALAKRFPDAANIDGSTPMERREVLIEDFKAGRRRVLISKPKILGFGLNLQAATRQVFSGLQDSYESYYQAVKRSNRIGSTRPLHVHIPVTEVEIPMVESVLSKAHRVQQDTEEQERLFRAVATVTP